MNILEQRFMESVPNSLRDIAKSLEKLAENTQKPVEVGTLYAVTYVGLSQNEWDANGFSNVHLCATLDAAKAKLAELRKAEIDNLKAEQRDYKVTWDENDQCRIEWCGGDEEIRLEIHPVELNK